MPPIVVGKKYHTWLPWLYLQFLPSIAYKRDQDLRLQPGSLNKKTCPLRFFCASFASINGWFCELKLPKPQKNTTCSWWWLFHHPSRKICASRQNIGSFESFHFPKFLILHLRLYHPIATPTQELESKRVLCQRMQHMPAQQHRTNEEFFGTIKVWICILCGCMGRTVYLPTCWLIFMLKCR